MSIADELLEAGVELREALDALSFAEPVTHVYNPLGYAWAPHSEYVRRYGDSRKRVVLLGMNPGPFGMAQTGVPFGEIAAVRDWMGIETEVGKPAGEHPKRPIEGFACTRSEVSGRRLWGMFSERYPDPADFFAEHFIANFCPLVFMEETGRNRTPDKLPAAERAPVYAACEAHLARVLEILRPEWAIGVGGFAQKRIESVANGGRVDVKTGVVLHPSPASPAANRGWAAQAAAQLQALGIWQG